MNDLDKLIEQRDKIRQQEKKLTQKIKTKRTTITEAKKQANLDKMQSNTIVDQYKHLCKKLRDQNAGLRRLIGMLKKADGSTYKQVGEFLGVSDSRARELVNSEKFRLNWIHSHDDKKT